MTSRFAPLLERRTWGPGTACAAMLALLVTATARTARAEVDLQWIAPAECPREDAVREKMRSLAALSLERVDRLSAEGEITRIESRYRLTLRVRIGKEVRERVIDSDACADLAGAAAVTLGLLLSSDGATDGSSSGDGAPATPPGTAPGEGSGAEKTEDATTPPVRAPPPAPEKQRGAAPAPAAPDDDPGAGLHFLLRAPVVALDLGPLPGPGFDLGGGAGIGYAAWQLVLAGRVGPSQTIERASLGGAGATVRRLAAELSVCRGFGAGTLELAPCLVAALEHVTAAGRGADIVPRTKRAAWAAPGAGLLARVHLSDPLSLVAGATGYLEIARPHLVIDDVGEVDQLAPVALRAFVGTDWVF